MNTTLIKTVESPHIVALLNEEKTNIFLNEFEDYFNKADFFKIYCLIGEMGLKPFAVETKFNKINDFMEEYYYNNSRIGKIISIKPFESKCFSCDFSKHLFAIQITFRTDKNKIETDELAVKIDVKNNCLTHFKFCKRFLKLDEMKQLD